MTGEVLPRVPTHVIDQVAASARDHHVTRRDVENAVGTLIGVRDGFANLPPAALLPVSTVLAVLTAAIAAHRAIGEQLR